MLKQKDIEKFTKLLEADLRDVQEKLKNPDEIIIQETGDDADKASAISSNGLSAQFRARSLLYANKLTATLKRIEDGIFGICMECEEEIPKARLEARPTTELCIGCKEEQEANESRNKNGLVSKSFSYNK